MQGSFCVCTRPMRDDVTMWRCLLLTRRIHKMIPENDVRSHDYSNINPKTRKSPHLETRNIIIIMGAKASQITSLTIAYSTVYSGADQRKRQSSTSLAFVWGIYRWPMNTPHKGPVTRKMFPFDDVIMIMWTLQWTNMLYELHTHLNGVGNYTLARISSNDHRFID